MKLEELEFGHWFKDKIDPTKLIEYQITRIVTVNKDSYLIRNEKKDVFAEVTGKYKFNADRYTGNAGAGKYRIRIRD